MSYIQYSTLIRNKVLNYMLNYGPETQNSYFYDILSIFGFLFMYTTFLRISSMGRCSIFSAVLVVNVAV